MLLDFSSFLILILSIIIYYTKQKANISIILLFVSFCVAFFYNYVSIVPLITTLILAFCIYLYYNYAQYKLMSFIFVTFLSIAFAAHLIPGFHGYQVYNDFLLSELSKHSIWLSFDKIMIAVLFILIAKISFEKEYKWFHLLKKVFFYWIALLVIIIPLSLLSDFIVLDIKLLPLEFFIVWSFKMLFFTVLAEELFFRYFLLNAIKDFAKNLKYKNEIALLISSLLFGIAHFGGGISFMLLAFVAGFFYGLIYIKTNKIESSILLHFLLNLTHLVFFTY